MKKLIALLFLLPLFAMAQTRPGIKVNTPQDFKKMVSMEGHFALVDTCLWWIYNSGADSAKLGFRNDSLILLNADGSIPKTNFGGGGGGSGTVTNIATSNGITGGPITTTGTISGVNSAADGSTKGVAAFAATDFNSSSGVISIDFTNAQKATGSQPGLLTAADWTTFNGKASVAGPDGSFELRNGNALKGTNYLYYDTTSWGGGKGFMQVKGNFTVVDSSDNQVAFGVVNIGQKPIIYMGDQDAFGNNTWFELNDPAQNIRMNVQGITEYKQDVTTFRMGSLTDSNYFFLNAFDEGTFAMRVSGSTFAPPLTLYGFAEDGLQLFHGSRVVFEMSKALAKFNPDSFYVLPLATAGVSKMVTVNSTGAFTSTTIPTGTVSSVTIGNLSPLFTASTSNNTTTPSTSFTLASAAARTVYGRGSGSGVPSFVTIDTNWFTNFYLMCRASFQNGYGLNFSSGKYSVDTTRNGTGPTSQWLMKHYADSLGFTLASLTASNTFTSQQNFESGNGIVIGLSGGTDGLIRLYNQANSNYVAIKSPSNVLADYIIELPQSAGADNSIPVYHPGLPMTWSQMPTMFVSKSFTIPYPNTQDALAQSPQGSSSATIKANTASDGETFVIKGQGYWTNFIGASFIMNLYLQGNNLTGISFFPVKSTTNELFEFEAFITVESTGGVGTVNAGGKFEYNWSNQTVQQIPMVMTSPANIDFTADATIEAQVDMSGQSGGSITFQRLTIERLNR